MIDKVSGGPITVFLIGAHTNFAIFLMKNPHLKKNVEHIYVMGGGVRSKNPTGCCPRNGTSSCQPRQCGDRGNLFTDYTSNPYAEFNVFGDPFAAYQVLPLWYFDAPTGTNMNIILTEVPKPLGHLAYYLEPSPNFHIILCY